MKWSWHLGEYAGIKVYIHATFLLIIGWVLLIHWMAGQNLAHAFWGVVFTVALFACVLLHEFGHALMARRYGIKTKDITLLPIGGVARLERMPDNPIQELWVALAGPAVNFFIAGLLLIWLLFYETLIPVERLSVTEGSLAERLMIANIFLVVFNMIPAFPMDGGRVLRALLATKLEYTRATQIAAHIGQGIALIFGFIGLLYNPFLVFIAFFVWIGASQESNMVQMKHALGGIPVSRAMITDFRTINATDTLSRAVDLIISGSQHDFPVMDNGDVVGILTRGALMKALANFGPETLVRDVMVTDFQFVNSHDMLETAFTKLQSCGCYTLPVERNNELVGLLTTDNVGEFLMIQAALHPKK